ncbi:MAG: hypothetical protein INQ03_00070 [Candidatus Heimdallarchaeota archaeon]|nr:hypothetical protein [Candidatus Heimdallarchaeota archaeon]
MSKISIPIIPEIVDKSKGCPHPDRVMKHTCEHCGASLCYDCFFEDVLRKKTKAVTSIDSLTSFSYGTFCASCFLQRIQKPKYMIHFKGTMIPDSSMKPIKPTYFRSTHTAIDFLFMFFFVMTFILFFFGPIFYTTQYSRAVKAYDAFEADLDRAIEVVEQIIRINS